MTDAGKVLYLSETEVRNDIHKKMEQRKKYRRNRRNRKIRYRKARFDNRKHSKRSERFSPTMVSKIHAHEKEIAFIRSVLPTKRLVLETGTFDMHLMKNPALWNKKVRHWGYQKGPNYGFANVKAMVLYRDGYTCQCCKGKKKDSKLEVHHIIYRRNGGSDEAENLVTLCHTCHTGLHTGKITWKQAGKRKGTLSFATQMNSIRVQLLKQHPEAIETFGFITKENRQMLGLLKEHYLDAAVIAGGGASLIFQTKTVWKKKCVSKGDFQKTKGVRSEQFLTTGKIGDFRKFDKVRYLGKEYFIKGRMASGYAILMDIAGKKVVFEGAPKGYKTPKLALLTRVSARKSWMVSEKTIEKMAG